MLSLKTFPLLKGGYGGVFFKMDVPEKLIRNLYLRLVKHLSVVVLTKSSQS